MLKGLLTILIVSLVLPGCSTNREIKTKADQPGFISGTVRFIDIEGGFYAIIGDDSTRYDPVNLPAEFRMDGLRVEFAGRRDLASSSIHMWGILIHIESIRKQE